MKIEIPPIVRSLSLNELAPELGDQAPVIQVWVNPPRELIGRLHAANAVIANQAAIAQKALKKKHDSPETKDAIEKTDQLILERNIILAELWSKGTDPATHLTAEEITQSEKELRTSNPNAFLFLVGRTIQMIYDWRSDTKNALKPKRT